MVPSFYLSSDQPEAREDPALACDIEGRGIETALVAQVQIYRAGRAAKAHAAFHEASGLCTSVVHRRIDADKLTGTANVEADPRSERPSKRGRGVTHPPVIHKGVLHDRAGL